MIGFSHDVVLLSFAGPVLFASTPKEPEDGWQNANVYKGWQHYDMLSHHLHSPFLGDQQFFPHTRYHQDFQYANSATYAQALTNPFLPAIRILVVFMNSRLQQEYQNSRGYPHTPIEQVFQKTNVLHSPDQEDFQPAHILASKK